MSCELATYGIPLITSNLPICHEIFDGFENVLFMDNDNFNFGFRKAFYGLLNKNEFKKQNNYFSKNTCSKEIELFSSIIHTIKNSNSI
ncbi:hypothetical protein D3C73_1303640 [compost metagenome]